MTVLVLTFDHDACLLKAHQQLPTWLWVDDKLEAFTWSALLFLSDLGSYDSIPCSLTFITLVFLNVPELGRHASMIELLYILFLWPGLLFLCMSTWLHALLFHILRPSFTSLQCALFDSPFKKLQILSILSIYCISSYFVYFYSFHHSLSYPVYFVNTTLKKKEPPSYKTLSDIKMH